MLAIYFIVAAIIVAISFYYAGRWEKPKNPKDWSFFDDEFDVLKCGATCAVFWPILMVLIIVFGPFLLFYRLGLRAKRKKNANAAKAVDSNL